MLTMIAEPNFQEQYTEKENKSMIDIYSNFTIGTLEVMKASIHQKINTDTTHSDNDLRRAQIIAIQANINSKKAFLQGTGV